jgi:hypothetical protein
MRKAIYLSQILILGITILTIGSCKKGDTGPQGPAGAAGNANVVSTTYNISSWPYNSPYYYCNLNVPAITSTNVNTSAIMVYFSTVNGVWNALPYTQYHSPYDYYMGFSVSTGSVQVTWVYDTSLNSGSDPNAYYSTTVQIKVVVIPPAMIRPGIHYRSYDELKRIYNIRE